MVKNRHHSCLSALSALSALVVAATGIMAQPQSAQLRTWTDSQNRKIEAAFGGLEGNSVLLKMADGQTVPWPLTRFCSADQAFIKTQHIPPAPATPTPKPPLTSPATVSSAAKKPSRVPLEQRHWPQVVEVPTKSIEVSLAAEKPLERKYIYQSESFEFSSQAKVAGSVMKEVARTFEATRALVRALPWGVACLPPADLERFKAALYETRADYIAAGAPELSGGLYDSAEKVFKIPFQSLGLEKRGQTYFKKDFANDTLVHEITHQMMDEYLAFLPVWATEGTAEYVCTLPYKAGVFRAEAHKTGLKDVIATWQNPPSIDGLENHLKMSRPGWVRATSSSAQMREMYHRSLLLVYYFCHLDGDKKGTRFIQFMEATYGDVLAVRTFFADPRVKKVSGGRFSYPANFKAPEMPSETSFVKYLPLLTGERTYAQLAADIVEGYKTIGIRVSAR